jgi:hypothetical protein
MRIRRLSATVGAVAFSVAMVLGGAAGPASAAKYKDCGTTVVGPGNSGMTQTETQIAQCHSSSDTGEQFGPVTNRGGGTPPGQQ